MTTATRSSFYDSKAGQHVRPVWLCRWTDAHGRPREMQLVLSAAASEREVETRLRSAYRHEVGSVLDVTRGRAA